VRRSNAFAFLAVAALVGCKSSSTAALEKFAEEYSCPTDRVTVKPRTDIKWSSVAFVDTRGAPPDEVKKDPQRLAKWEEDQRKQYAPLIESLDEHDVFEARGCDHAMLVGCKRPAKSQTPGNPPICMMEEIPKGQ
jgi:hypothetical protein